MSAFQSNGHDPSKALVSTLHWTFPYCGRITECHRSLLCSTALATMKLGSKGDPQSSAGSSCHARSASRCSMTWCCSFRASLRTSVSTRTTTWYCSTSRSVQQGSSPRRRGTLGSHGSTNPPGRSCSRPGHGGRRARSRKGQGRPPSCCGAWPRGDENDGTARSCFSAWRRGGRDAIRACKRAISRSSHVLHT